MIPEPYVMTSSPRSQLKVTEEEVEWTHYRDHVCVSHPTITFRSSILLLGRLLGAIALCSFCS